MQNRLAAIGKTASDERTAHKHVEPVETVSLARVIISSERYRQKVLGPLYKTGGAWSVLVYLYDAHEAGAGCMTTEASYGTENAVSSTLRWTREMLNDGLITRTADPADRRKTLLSLTDEGLSKMRRCLAFEANLYRAIFSP